MALFGIKHRFSGAVLFSLECGSLKVCVETAVKSGAYLDGANLRGADLRGAYLGGAYLRDANLDGANLRGANLDGAYLGGAYLRDANLDGANLRGAYLGGANLRGAKLCGDLKLSGERPYLAIGPLGSRSDYLHAFTTMRGLYVRAGCFFGTLDEFKAAVAETHGDNIHAREYAAAVAMIEAHAAAWPAVVEATEAA